MSNDQVSVNETVNAQFGEQSESVDTALAEKQTAEAKSELESINNQDTESEEKTKEDVDFSRKFAALSRKEKDLRNREVEYEQKVAEMEAKIKELEEKNTPKEEPKLPLEYRLKKDPLGTLQELGFDYEALTELAMNDGKLSQDMQMKLMREELENDYKSRFEELENKLTEKEKQDAENNYQTIVNNFKTEIDKYVEQSNEECELIRANNANDLIFDVIEEHYNETNRVLDIKDAAEAVEAYLLEEAQKLLKLKKLSHKQEALEESKPEIKRQSSPTLSNDHSAMSENKTERKLNREDSIYDAAKLIKWD